MTAMVRLVVWLAVLVLSAGPALAEGSPIDVASLLRDGGPWGAVTVCATVVGILWWALRSSQEARITDGREMNKEATEALKVNAEAMFKLGAIVEASAKGADERWRTLNGLLEALTPIQTGIASNGSALGRMEADIRAMLDREARR